MPAVRALERFQIEVGAADRRAHDEAPQMTVGTGQIGQHRTLAVPAAEFALDEARLLPLRSPRAEELELRMRPERRAKLHAAPLVVVAVTLARADRGKARLERRDLPLIVARGQIVDLGARVQLPPREERPLESQRVADFVRRELVRQA